MPENIKYVISKTKDNAKFYLCPHKDGNVSFYSFSDEEHYENFMVEIKKRVERVILRIEAIYHEEGGTNNGSNRQ